MGWFDMEPKRTIVENSSERKKTSTRMVEGILAVSTIRGIVDKSS